MKQAKTFYLNPQALEKWLHQNKAEYTGKFAEGVLLDSFVVQTKRGYAALIERATTEWTSAYTVIFQEGAAPVVWWKWYELERSVNL